MFTLAPDPHATIRALDRSGALTRTNFGDQDEKHHFWFRVRLVQRLAESAEHLALFPRPHLHREIRELVGVVVEDDPSRFTVVPEGIDVTVSVEAERGLVDHPERCVALDALVSSLPAHRHGLPLVVSVGRLSAVKGMAAIAQAWATDAHLRALQPPPRRR